MDRVEKGSDVSVVGRGARIEGTLVAVGALRVEGEVKGAISAKGDLSLTREGRVEADIQAENVTLAGNVTGNITAEADVSLPPASQLHGSIRARNVEVGGEVRGDIQARGKVELGPRARVEGDITSKRLAIAEGAVFSGRSMMDEEKTRPTERMAARASAGSPAGSK